MGRQVVLCLAILFGFPLLAVRADGGDEAGASDSEARWQSFVADAQNYGSRKVTVRPGEEGSTVYVVETRLLVELLGQREEIISRGRYRVDSDYVPIELEVDTEQASGRSRLIGKRVGGELELVFTRPGFERKASLSVAAGPIPLVCLDDWLRKRPLTSDRFTLHLLNEEAVALDIGRVERIDRNEQSTSWSVDVADGSISATYTIDESGLREADFRRPRYRLVRGTEETARSFQPRKLVGREILSLPAGRPIGRLQDLKSMTVRVRWHGIPYEEFDLEDSRQKVLEHTQNGDDHGVVIRVGSPQAAEPIELTDRERQRYLATTRFIRPEDPAIRDKAAEWIDSQTQPRFKVEALAKSVFDYLHGGTPIAETLSGPEVLSCRQGKCSEFSSLFASLARSVGIPTRIALGERLMPSGWIGHMWNEVHIDGQWITVDTTTGEVGHAPALLKFVDSESLDGTQPLRWDLTGSLELEILTLSPKPEQKFELVGNQYSSTAYQCRVVAPESWIAEEVPGEAVTAIRFRVPDQNDVLIHFVPLDLPVPMPPSVLFTIRSARFTTLYKGYKVLVDEPVSVAGHSGRRMTFRRASMKHESGSIVTTELIWSGSKGTFLLSLIAEEDEHDEFLPSLLALAESFRPYRPPVEATRPMPKVH